MKNYCIFLNAEESEIYKIFYFYIKKALGVLIINKYIYPNYSFLSL